MRKIQLNCKYLSRQRFGAKRCKQGLYRLSLCCLSSEHVRDVREPGDAFQFQCLIEVHQLHVAFDVVIVALPYKRNFSYSEYSEGGGGQRSEKRSEESIWIFS